MLMIGERINAARPAVRSALAGRDAGLIREEARAQAAAGADYIDVNGATSPDEELDNMTWLCEQVQKAVDLPLCIDSASPAVIEQGLNMHRRGRPLVNSITMERGRHEEVLPLVKRHHARVVALALDDSGIPGTAAGRLRVVERVVAAAAGNGIALSDVFIDPLVMAVSADNGSARLALEVIKGIKAQWPELQTVCGLSNVSFGLPNRRLVNRTFAAMLIAWGLDSAILDPLDERLAATVITARALIGRDDFCMEYLKAYRAKRLEG